MDEIIWYRFLPLAMESAFNQYSLILQSGWGDWKKTFCLIYRGWRKFYHQPKRGWVKYSTDGKNLSMNLINVTCGSLIWYLNVLFCYSTYIILGYFQNNNENGKWKIFLLPLSWDFPTRNPIPWRWSKIPRSCILPYRLPARHPSIISCIITFDGLSRYSALPYSNKNWVIYGKIERNM